MQFFLTVLGVILLICAMLYIILRVVFLMAFAIPERNTSPLSLIPESEQYDSYRKRIENGIREISEKEFEPVYIKSYDGLLLFGRLYKNDRQDIIEIAFHGYRSSPYLDFCGGSCLSKSMGVSTILVDQRGHGKSEGKAITFGIKERLDVLSWANFISQRFSDSKILLSGLSMGASTVLMASELKLPENVIGILADCPYSSPSEIILKVARDKGFNPKLIYPFIRLSARLFAGVDIDSCSAVEAVKHARLPILIIHGDDDRFVPHSMGKAIYDAAESPVKRFLSVRGAGHGMSYFADNDGYVGAVKEFVEGIIKKG